MGVVCPHNDDAELQQWDRLHPGFAQVTQGVLLLESDLEHMLFLYMKALVVRWLPLFSLATTGVHVGSLAVYLAWSVLRFPGPASSDYDKVVFGMVVTLFVENAIIVVYLNALPQFFRIMDPGEGDGAACIRFSSVCTLLSSYMHLAIADVMFSFTAMYMLTLLRIFQSATVPLVLYACSVVCSCSLFTCASVWLYCARNYRDSIYMRYAYSQDLKAI